MDKDGKRKRKAEENSTKLEKGMFYLAIYDKNKVVIFYAYFTNKIQPIIRIKNKS